MDEPSSTGRRPTPLDPGTVPIVVGGVALVAGLGLALWSARPSSPSTSEPTSTAPSAPSPTPLAERTATSSAFAQEPPAPAPGDRPNLGGEDLGEAVTSSGANAHGLAVVGRRLVWIETDHAIVASRPLDRAEETVLSRSDDEEVYGGAFAASGDGVFWSVADLAGAPHPIYFVTAEDLRLTRPTLTPLAEAASSDDLAIVGDDVYVADGGRLMRLSPQGLTLVADERGRIVDLTACGGRPVWLEAPLRGAGRHALASLDAEGEVVLLAALTPATRGPMGCLGGRPVWAESAEDDVSHAIRRLGDDGPERLAVTGLVSALTASQGRLFFSEVHGEGSSTVSLLRSIGLAEGAPRRLGRDRGTITALVVHRDTLFWASDDGLSRHHLADPD